MSYLHALTEAELKSAKRMAEIAENLYREEKAIVDRIWDQLGRPSYEELNGRSIHDLIDELKARAETKETA